MIFRKDSREVSGIECETSNGFFTNPKGCQLVVLLAEAVGDNGSEKWSECACKSHPRYEIRAWSFYLCDDRGAGAVRWTSPLNEARGGVIVTLSHLGRVSDQLRDGRGCRGCADERVEGGHGLRQLGRSNL